MIAFEGFNLNNGLRVIVHEDNSTPMVAVSVLYDVGSKDEHPDKTGFAHLFEHLMFGGSEEVPDFDGMMQRAGGESNAFTSADFTNYYDVIPADNLEVAFWLESDRMRSLNFSPQSLETQRKVVLEEFKETCLNQPYGDVWHILSKLTYTKHPYQWPTIGVVPEHIEKASIEDVKSFFYKHYRPNNAYLIIAGNTTVDQVKILAEKWFGDIPKGKRPERNIPAEPTQTDFKCIEHKANVPSDALYLAFHMPGRLDDSYYAIDLLSDVLCNGPSSRLYRKLLKEQHLFSEIDCYISGNIEEGLFVIEGKPSEGVSLEQAEATIWKELEQIKNKDVSFDELQKIKNKMESTLTFTEASILHKALNLSFFTLLGNTDRINQEAERYQNVTLDDIHIQANKILRKENCSELIYRKG